MSEAELHVLRGRLEAGKRNKGAPVNNLDKVTAYRVSFAAALQLSEKLVFQEHHRRVGFGQLPVL